MRANRYNWVRFLRIELNQRDGSMIETVLKTARFKENLLDI